MLCCSGGVSLLLLCCVRCDGERSLVVLKLAVPDDDDGAGAGQAGQRLAKEEAFGLGCDVVLRAAGMRVVRMRWCNVVLLHSRFE